MALDPTQIHWLPSAMTAARIIGDLTPATDKVPYYTGASTAALATFNSAGRSLAEGKLPGFTVAGLPAGSEGMIAYVTDALAPTFLAAVVGGGAVKTPVFYDGTNWVSF